MAGPCDLTPTSPNDAVAGFCLTLSGKTLYLKALLAAKSFGIVEMKKVHLQRLTNLRKKDWAQY